MKLRLRCLLIIFLLSLAVGSSYCESIQSNITQTHRKRQWTKTLLPVKEKTEQAKEQPGRLWIQNDPKKDIFLQFDLSGLPPGLKEEDFLRCTLRLVAHNVVYQPADNPNSGGPKVIVKGRLVNDDFTGDENTPAIISLSTLSDQKKVAKKTTETFAMTVYKEYSGDKKISLRLFSDSHKASTLFYSSANSDKSVNPSNLPRLVIEFAPPPPELLDTLSWSQHQQNPEHTGRSPWIPFLNPSGFTLKKIKIQEGTIADYPLIYRGNIYLVNKIDNINHLVALDFKGQELWRQEIGKGTVQRSPVISREGIIYIVTEKEIAGYDINRSEEPFVSTLPGNLSDYTDLTMGNDGSLFLALKENDVNYVYGFTPKLKPFLKSGPFGKGQEKISTVTVSPDGRTIFFQTPKGAVTIDITDPATKEVILKNGDERPLEYYHTPIAGPAGGIMIFSDFTSKANRGNIWGYSDKERIWNVSGTLLPQPVLGSNGLVYYIQGGVLNSHIYSKYGKPQIAGGEKLKSSSNLVMDSADNVYFWDNGYLHRYSRSGEPLFDKVSFVDSSGLEKNRAPDPEENSDGNKAAWDDISMGPEQFIRLMLGPDGSLWANNKNGSSLFAFTPGFAEPDLVLAQEDMKTQTTYRATGTLTMGGVTLEPDAQMLFQARKGMTFLRGFRVKKGASMLCRTGF